MSKPWRVLWDEVDEALKDFEESQVKAMAKYLKALRLAISKYGRNVDPGAFDEYGQPIEVDSL